MCYKCSKFICCNLDLTIATRFIAFVGIAISIILMTALMNDKYISKNNYDISRTTALALGLDWKHFHNTGSIKAEDDPDGRMVSIIVAFYSVAFLFINLLLFFGSIKCDWCCAIPWLFCEFFGCLSKFGALMYHLNCQPFHLSIIFIVGSVMYICVIIWWWLVVFFAQKLWRRTQKFELEVELSTPKKPRKKSLMSNVTQEISVLESPIPYEPNQKIVLI